MPGKTFGADETKHVGRDRSVRGVAEGNMDGATKSKWACAAVKRALFDAELIGHFDALPSVSMCDKGWVPARRSSMSGSQRTLHGGKENPTSGRTECVG